MNKSTLRHLSLAYDLCGSGPSVLLIHGFPLTGRMWSPIVEPLARSYRLIIPDLRGYGESQAGSTATMVDFADDAAALLDHLGETEPVVVIGLSMGGYIAFEFLRRHRERVRALGLIDTRAEGDSPEGAKGRRDQAQRVRAEGSKVVADGMRDKLFGPRVDPAVKQAWYEIMAGANPKAVAATLEGLAERFDFTPTLGQIDVPTLIVVGEDDVITPPAGARAMHRAIPGAVIEVIPECGHVPPLEQPERFRRVLKKWLDGLTS